MMRSQTWKHASFAVAWSLCAVSGCSNADPRETENGERRQADEQPAEQVVPPGTSLVFSVDQQVSTQTHDEGDVFSATLRYGVSDGEGGEMVPRGIRSRWVVREASTMDGGALLAVQLTSIQVNGEWTPVVGDVTQAEVQEDRSDTGSETGAEIAVGTAVALTTRSGKAVLPEGSIITVRLMEPLVVS